MLLAKNPTKYIELRNVSTRKYHSYVNEYENIAEKLHFLDFVDQSGEIAVRNRTKYKILQSGSGLYSLLPPPHLVPSDPQGVLRELQKAIAEYRAGNKSMRNIISPLIHQARRMKILPKKECQKMYRQFNWVYT